MKLILVSLLFCVSAFADLVHQDLVVKLNIEKSEVEVVAHITPEVAGDTFQFVLNKNLSIAPSSQLKVIRTDGEIKHYNFNLKKEKSFTISYKGKINYPVVNESSIGLINSKGVTLYPGTFWYPVSLTDNKERYTFSLNVKDDKGWTYLSNESSAPQDGIYLMGYDFVVKSETRNGVTAKIYLRNSDEELADKFLDLTHAYIRMFSKEIGPYPYKSFSVVENFYQTGYGMPGFTLLGSQVLRLPFIVHTSFPHEILHNWWGNSVYIDFSKGNWAEGLTTYMSDHAMAEIRRSDSDYRKNALKSYKDYVSKKNDFPISEFRTRHNKAMQAVGYNKTLMLFRMLEVKLDRHLFQEGLKKFYHDNKFKYASFDDIQSAFEEVSKLDLDTFFHQWVKWTGAPDLRVSFKRINNKKIELKIEQIQKDLYELYIPVSVDARYQIVELKEKEKRVVLTSNEDIKKVLVDPRFDVFRVLDDREVTPSFSTIFGTKENVQIVLPSQSKLLGLYTEQANIFKSKFSKASIVLDSSVKKLSKYALIIGEENKFKDYVFESVVKSGVKEGEYPKRKLELDSESYSFVFGDKKNVRMFLSTRDKSIIKRLAMKIPHYGKYSLLSFKGERNTYKGVIPASDSPFIFGD